MTAHHDHNSHHHTHHHHSESEVMSVREKLQKLLDHWQHHNEDHMQSFAEWERKAREEGLQEVAEALKKVSELTREINRELATALNNMERK